MNKDRLTILADKIEAAPEHLDMGWWWAFADGGSTTAQQVRANGSNPADCGTTACLAGWAVGTWPEEVDCNDGFPSAAARILDLSEDQEAIFGCCEWDADMVVAQLRRWATGDLSWIDEDDDEDTDQGEEE